VIVEAVPLAVTEVGLAVTEDCEVETAPAVNVIEAVWLTVILSVESVAVRVGVPEMLDFTVKVATPEALVVADEGEIVSVPARLELRLTTLPAMALPVPSFKVTNTVEVELPLAVTEVGLALTVD
jgi:hypothetical protein